MSNMIVLKNLARDFDINPYQLRMKLRAKFGKRARWRWDENSEIEMIDLKKIRTFLKKSIAPPPAS